MLHHIGDALAQNLGNEEAAVEQNRVGLGVARSMKKRRQMTRHGRIGYIGQADFAKRAALFFLGLSLNSHSGRKPSSASSRTSSRRISVLSVPPTSDDPPPSTVISTLFRSGCESSFLFGRRALAAQSAALAHGERFAELRLHQPRERQIQIVTAQQQMLSDGGARELDAIAFAPPRGSA